MDILEIILLIAGAVIFILSFFLPAKGEKISEDSEKMAKEEIKQLVSQEMDAVRSHVDDVVEEAVGYAVEKTERSLERLSNEKIMAVSEYSDTVLAQIHKDHEEAMFLYDMLNNKHASLKSTVSEADRTAKEVDRTVKEAEEKASTFQKLMPEQLVTSGTEPVPRQVGAAGTEPAPRQVGTAGTEPEAVTEQAGRISFIGETDEEGGNSNEKILALYRQGKSRVAIAKELGLGVGEVKLVIDLYKNQ